MSETTFTFWTQADIIKGHGDDAPMRMGGIASTMDEDADGEFLDPNGFDLDYFLKAGTVNWHHQGAKDPLANIGEPYHAEIRPKEGMYIEVELYKDNDLACRAFKQAQILQKGSKTRKLGFSIEGKALQRGSEDKNHPDYLIIKKAMITGVAITHMPKNTNTFADIIKGHGVDNDGQPIAFGKSLDTSSGNALVKESVDDDMKVLSHEETEENEKKKNEQNGSDLVEGEVLELSKAYEKIFFSLGDITVSDAERVYELSNLISQQRMKKGKNFAEEGVTAADIEKAVSLLNAGDDDRFSKGEDPEDDDDDDDDEEEEEDDDTDVKKGLNSNTFGRGGNYAGLIQKGFSAIENQMESKNQALGVIMKGMYDVMIGMSGTVTDMSEKMDALASENAELRKGLETPNERKSIATAKPAERTFAKGIENDIDAGATVDSKTIEVTNKRAVCQILDDLTFNKGGFDQTFSKALTGFSASGNISNETILAVKQKTGYTIIDSRQK